ncbi:MAG TPA: YrrS family protein, partial [Bacillaceae bacterium]
KEQQKPAASKEKTKEDENESEADEDEPDEQESEMVEKESDEENVEKVIVNPGWEPVGTQQTGGHQPSSSMGSVDWNEKVQAAAYGADIPVENMTVWWLERGEIPDKTAVATVSAKGSDDTYRVYIEWVDGEGWKPTQVKKLIHNDKR